MRLDSHQHFWNYEPDKHAWIDEGMAAIRRDFTPEDLEPILRQGNFDGCVAVQADQTTAETDFLLRLAEEHPFIKAVVGWIDLRAENLPEQLVEYAGKEKLKGWRHVVQGEPDPLFLLREDFLRGIETIGRAGYTYDILIFPHQLVSALELVKLFPEVNFVIDHLAKPYLKAGYLEGWAAGLAAFAPYPNACCKVSGLVTEGDYQKWTPESLTPYLDVVFQTFPTERVIFGSDWPVCRVATSHARWTTVVEDYLAARPDLDSARVMGE
ncbi:MAG: amidohydrolase family protein, partial [Bacteroidota bacterium]